MCNACTSPRTVSDGRNRCTAFGRYNGGGGANPLDSSFPYSPSIRFMNIFYKFLPSPTRESLMYIYHLIIHG
jgi:hypothetical protein